MSHYQYAVSHYLHLVTVVLACRPCMCGTGPVWRYVHRRQAEAKATAGKDHAMIDLEISQCFVIFALGFVNQEKPEAFMLRLFVFGLPGVDMPGTDSMDAVVGMRIANATNTAWLSTSPILSSQEVGRRSWGPLG